MIFTLSLWDPDISPEVLRVPQWWFFGLQTYQLWHRIVLLVDRITSVLEQHATSIFGPWNEPSFSEFRVFVSHCPTRLCSPLPLCPCEQLPCNRHHRIRFDSEEGSSISLWNVSIHYTVSQPRKPKSWFYTRSGDVLTLNASKCV